MGVQQGLHRLTRLGKFGLLDHEFPNLNPGNFRPTSPINRNYNCIAWAAEVDDEFWWPSPAPDAAWPKDVPQEESIPAFIAAYATLGYEVCQDGLHENDYQKVAVYALNGIPTHAARSLANGKWTSKLGRNIDIEHDDLDCVNGPVYGAPHVFLRKKLPNG